jgi:hypothetical protein
LAHPLGLVTWNDADLSMTAGPISVGTSNAIAHFT